MSNQYKFSDLMADVEKGKRPAEPTITLSEHAARLQAACVELRSQFISKVSLMIEHRSSCALKGGQDCECSASDVVRAVCAIPVPTAALETAIAEARFSEANIWHDTFWSSNILKHVCGPDFRCTRIRELQAAVDAAKAKESK